MTNLSLILANEVEQISLQVSTFANGPWKENFLGIDFRQIDQNSRDLRKSCDLWLLLPDMKVTLKQLSEMVLTNSSP